MYFAGCLEAYALQYAIFMAYCKACVSDLRDLMHVRVAIKRLTYQADFAGVSDISQHLLGQ